MKEKCFFSTVFLKTDLSSEYENINKNNKSCDEILFRSKVINSLCPNVEHYSIKVIRLIHMNN